MSTSSMLGEPLMSQCLEHCDIGLTGVLMIRTLRHGIVKTIRRELLTDFALHTMLRLPTGIFYAQGVKANVLFFDEKAARFDRPWTERVWVYDLRTDQHFTLKQRPLTRVDLDDFVVAYQPGMPTSSRVESERFKSFTYDEIVEDLTAALAEFEAIATAREACRGDARFRREIGEGSRPP